MGSLSHGLAASSGPKTDTVCGCSRPCRRSSRSRSHGAEVGDEGARSSRRTSSRLRRVHLVPEVPGEERAALPPQRRVAKREPRLDDASRSRRAGQAGATGGRRGRRWPGCRDGGARDPGAEGVERGQQEAHADAARRARRGRPRAAPCWVRSARRAARSSGCSALGVLQHQAQDRDAVAAEPADDGARRRAGRAGEEAVRARARLTRRSGRWASTGVAVVDEVGGVRATRIRPASPARGSSEAAPPCRAAAVADGRSASATDTPRRSEHSIDGTRVPSAGRRELPSNPHVPRCRQVQAALISGVKRGIRGRPSQ